MTAAQETIDAHLASCRAMLAQAFAQLRQTDPAAYAVLNDAVRVGAAVRLTTSLSRAGLCEVGVVVVMPDGAAVTVADVEFGEPGRAH